LANKKSGIRPAKILADEKLQLLKKVLTLSQQQLLLVDLEKLSPLLEQKDEIIEAVAAIDQEAVAAGYINGEEWESLPQQEELANILEAILENETALERRIQVEFSQLRGDLREFDRENRLKKYLQSEKPRKGRINLKR